MACGQAPRSIIVCSVMVTYSFGTRARVLHGAATPATGRSPTSIILHYATRDKQNSGKKGFEFSPSYWF